MIKKGAEIMEEKIFPIPELPRSYGDNRIVLLVRDPHWLYAYWEISEEKRWEISSTFGNDIWKKAKLTLKLHQIEPKYHIEKAIFINPWANNYYINVDEADCVYLVKLGLTLEENNTFISLITSNEIKTPANTISSVIDEKWSLIGNRFFYKMQSIDAEQTILGGDYSSAQLINQEEK